MCVLYFCNRCVIRSYQLSNKEIIQVSMEAMTSISDAVHLRLESRASNFRPYFYLFVSSMDGS